MNSEYFQCIQGIIIKELETIIKAQTSNTIILGCTELSLFSAQIFVPDKRIIDPLEVVYCGAHKNLIFDWLRLRSIDPPRYPSQQGRASSFGALRFNWALSRRVKKSNFYAHRSIAKKVLQKSFNDIAK